MVAISEKPSKRRGAQNRQLERVFIFGMAWDVRKVGVNALARA